jgi:2'-5' RNA ligase
MPPRGRRKFGPLQKERIFFAALPDSATAAQIYAQAEALQREHGFTGVLILPEHLHVTLFHLGDWAYLPGEIVTLAKNAAAQVNFLPFAVTFPRAESFRNSTGVYPFVLTGDEKEWAALHNALAASLAKFGLGGATRGEFKPHVTLVYDKVRAKPLKIAPISWTVREFVLIHSMLGKTTHERLGSWAFS